MTWKLCIIVDLMNIHRLVVYIVLLTIQREYGTHIN